MRAHITRQVTYVVKTSKLCNLRCRYCYEFAELGKRDRMTREQLRRMYENLVDYYGGRDEQEGERTRIVLVWHGGEPLLIEPAFYRETFADQAEIFGARVERSNSIQSNLTVLDDERIELLRSGFDNVGVSADLFGGLRVNAGGRDPQDRVLRNMERLREAGVSFGCITVLHRGNIDQVDRIWRFYERAGLPFRTLPLFDGATAEQNSANSLSATEISAALCRFADLWLASDRPVAVLPIAEYIGDLMRLMNPNDTARRYYDKRDWVWVIRVNTNGDCFTDGDPYGDPNWVLGNIFTTPLDEIFAGKVFDRSATETEHRIAANCLRCPFFGGCDGHHIGDHIDNVYEYRDGIPVCRLNRSVLAHLQRRWREGGLVDADGMFDATAPA